MGTGPAAGDRSSGEYLGSTRRQLLARGGVVIAAAYAAPVVSVLSMTSAHAQEASGVPGTAVLDTVRDRPGAARQPVVDGAVPPSRQAVDERRVLPFTGGEQAMPVAVATALVAAGGVMTAAAHRSASGVAAKQAPPSE